MLTLLADSLLIATGQRPLYRKDVPRQTDAVRDVAPRKGWGLFASFQR